MCSRRHGFFGEGRFCHGPLGDERQILVDLERRGPGEDRRRHREVPQGGRDSRSRGSRRRGGEGRAGRPRVLLRRAHLQLQPARKEGVERPLQGALRHALQLRDRRVLLAHARAVSVRPAFRGALRGHRGVLEPRVRARPEGCRVQAALASPRARSGDQLPQDAPCAHPRPSARLGQQRLAHAHLALGRLLP